ncbi:MAG TPA: hypothetical protein VF450_03420 [Noviherbaspirillum sp.]
MDMNKLQTAQKVREIIFPGNDGQPCVAQYGIAFDRESIARAEIVVVQSHEMRGTSLWNTDEGRNNVLNRILSHDLQGVRVEFIGFTCVFDANDGLHAIRFPIHLDYKDFIDQGNPVKFERIAPRSLIERCLTWIGRGPVETSWWSGHVKAGCARVFVEFEERVHLPTSKVALLLDAIGYDRTEAALKRA